MKKLVSIGVALALLTIAIVPGAVAAYSPMDPPESYAKTPFAIIASGLELVGDIVDALQPAGLGIPEWIGDVTSAIAPWTYGPLAWTVDMMGWGVHLVGEVVAQAGPILDAAEIDLPLDLADVATLIDTVACGLRTCFESGCSGNWTCP